MFCAVDNLKSVDNLKGRCFAYFLKVPSAVGLCTQSLVAFFIREGAWSRESASGTYMPNSPHPAAER